MTDIQGLLGDEADTLLTHVSKGIPKDDLTLPGGDIVDRVYKDSDRSPQVLRNLQAMFGHGRLAEHRPRVDPPGRPGHRALGRGVVRAQPEVLRPEEHRRAGHRRRVQRGGHHLRGARAVLTRLRPQDPLHREDQPQRAAHLPERVRPDHVRLGRAGLRPRRGRRGGHHLLRLAGIAPPDHRGQRGVPAGPRARHVHRAVVLPPQQRLQGRRRRLPRLGRPDRRRPTTWA